MTNSDTSTSANAETQEALEDYTQMLRDKILFALTIYPALAPYMLHPFLGTSTSTHVWKPILNALIAEGLVEKVEVTLKSPMDRQQTYTIIRRTDKDYVRRMYTLQTTPDDTNNTNDTDNVSVDKT